MDTGKAFYLISLKIIVRYARKVAPNLLTTEFGDTVSYARKATLNLLATELGDTARFTGSGEIECLLTGVK